MGCEGSFWPGFQNIYWQSLKAKICFSKRFHFSHFLVRITFHFSYSVFLTVLQFNWTSQQVQSKTWSLLKMSSKDPRYLKKKNLHICQLNSYPAISQIWQPLLKGPLIYVGCVVGMIYAKGANTAEATFQKARQIQTRVSPFGGTSWRLGSWRSCCPMNCCRNHSCSSRCCYSTRCICFHRR